jgi:hypothetical protein
MSLPRALELAAEHGIDLAAAEPAAADRAVYVFRIRN